MLFPGGYRQDVRELRDAFAFSLSPVGFRFSGFYSRRALGRRVFLPRRPPRPLAWHLGFDYSVIPYLTAFLGAVSAGVLALFQAPSTALLAALLLLLIQQLEGNVLTLPIQGETWRVPSVQIFRHRQERYRGPTRLRRAERCRAEGILRLLSRSSPHQELVG
jgi:hypothetical protein